MKGACFPQCRCTKKTFCLLSQCLFFCVCVLCISMAGHEALCIVWDIGGTMMSRTDDAANEAKKVVMMLVQNKIQFQPRDELGIVLIGAKATNNHLADQFEGQYRHVDKRHSIRVPDLESFKSLHEVQCEGARADFPDGLILATDLLFLHKCAKNVNKRIFLITDAATRVHMEPSELCDVKDAMQKQGISLFVIGVDFEAYDEDADYDELPSDKRRNEYMLYNLCDALNGVVIPLRTASATLAQLRAKTVKQVTCFQGVLEVAGDGRSPDGAFAGMGIRVFGYLKTKPAAMPPLAKSSGRARRAKTLGDHRIDLDRRYFSQDAPDEEVDAAKKIKAYRYGRSLIPFGAVDEQMLKFESAKSLKVVCFTARARIPHGHVMGQTYMFCAPPGDAEASKAVAALVHAMYETESVAVVRYVRVRNAQPYLGILHPKIKPDQEFFYFHTLPFAEDLRQYVFRSNQEAKEKLCAAERDKLDAVQALVASMDLMKAGPEGTEALKPKTVFNPCLQHLYQATRHRAVHPSAPLVTLDKNIATFARAWEDKGVLRKMLDDARPAIRKVVELFPLKALGGGREPRRHWFAADGVDVSLDSYAKAGDKRPPDAERLLPEAKRFKGGYFDGGGGLGTGDETSLSRASSLSALDKVSVDGILSNKVAAVGTVNPVKDFQDMFNRRDEDLVDKAIAEMQHVVRHMLRASINDQYYGKVALSTPPLSRLTPTPNTL